MNSIRDLAGIQTPHLPAVNIEGVRGRHSPEQRVHPVRLPKKHRHNPVNAKSLTDRIEGCFARITVIGQGYVGLPLAVEFARAGFAVTGLDTSRERVAALNDGRSHSPDVSDKTLKVLRTRGHYGASCDFDAVHESDVLIICVPTPPGGSKDPNSSFVMAAAEEVACRLHAGQLVVLESTSYPGITEELLLPLFAGNAGIVGKDFFLAFSPECIDPSNVIFKGGHAPKIVGGMTANCLRLATLLYSQIAIKVMQVSGSKVTRQLLKKGSMVCVRLPTPAFPPNLYLTSYDTTPLGKYSRSLEFGQSSTVGLVLPPVMSRQLL